MIAVLSHSNNSSTPTSKPIELQRPAPPPAMTISPAELLKSASDIEARYRKEVSDQKAPKVPLQDLEVARGQLDRIPQNDPTHVGAVKVLARFQEDVAKAAAIEGPKKRRELAAEMQHQMLMNGQDSSVAAEGQGATTLHIYYVLAGAPMAEQMKTEGTFLQRCREIGVKHVVLDDKFGKTWTFSL